MRSLTRALALTALACLSACGVAGRPRPPGPQAPPAPQIAQRITPEGVQIKLTADLPPDPPPRGHLYAVTADGPQLIATAPLNAWRSWPQADTIQAALSVGPILGPLSPVTARPELAPLPAPEPPLIFEGANGLVEITWLPPEGATTVRIFRGEVMIAEVIAEAATATDRPSPGKHQYRVQGVSEAGISPRSEGAEIEITSPGPHPQR